ncbi:MAG: PxxKW family cysteine-rich protein [Thermodesulfobacteriota bacterium]
MQCATFKQGIECAFMTNKGCTFNGGRCHTVVDSCNGCGKAQTFEQGIFCTVAPNPAAKWSRGNCNFATHASRSTAAQEEKMLNPLKASKRAASGKR